MAKDYTQDLSDEQLADSQVQLDDAATKQAVVFRILKASKGLWVPVPDLGRAARTRNLIGIISRVRRRGAVVENRQEPGHEHGEFEGWEGRSWYRLLKEPKDILAERDAEKHAGNLL